ncbi:MAG TPA: hypothetical protein DEP66_02705 [Acidimicrobiaceae bacterium]|nr:hypothetical protein [Acidimicrobiaceae bacterium]
MTPAPTLPLRPAAGIVVVAYGRRPLLERLLRSIDEHTAPPHEVVVVDNDSPDDTVDWLRRNRPDVRLVQAGANLGYGQGVNLGVRHIRADAAVAMNSDVVVTAGWLEPLLEALARPGVVIAAPVQLGSDVPAAAGGSVCERGARIGWDGLVHARRGAAPRTPGRNGDADVVPVDHASAACWAVDRAWFERNGGFDPLYGLGYFEDVDLVSLANSDGRQVVLALRSEVVHPGGGSFTPEAAAALTQRNHPRCAGRWEWQLRGRPEAPAADAAPSEPSYPLIGAFAQARQ